MWANECRHRTPPSTDSTATASERRSTSRLPAAGHDVQRIGHRIHTSARLELDATALRSMELPDSSGPQHPDRSRSEPESIGTAHRGLRLRSARWKARRIAPASSDRVCTAFEGAVLEFHGSSKRSRAPRRSGVATVGSSASTLRLVAAAGLSVPATQQGSEAPHAGNGLVRVEASASSARPSWSRCSATGIAAPRTGSEREHRRVKRTHRQMVCVDYQFAYERVVCERPIEVIATTRAALRNLAVTVSASAATSIPNLLR